MFALSTKRGNSPSPYRDQEPLKSDEEMAERKVRKKRLVGTKLASRSWRNSFAFFFFFLVEEEKKKKKAENIEMENRTIKHFSCRISSHSPPLFGLANGSADGILKLA